MSKDTSAEKFGAFTLQAILGLAPSNTMNDIEISPLEYPKHILLHLGSLDVTFMKTNVIYIYQSGHLTDTA